MAYRENPKTKGSEIICCIPQSGKCPIGCRGCFFNSAGSYLDPVSENLPNMPTLREVGRRIVRVNDGHDSNYQYRKVIDETKQYPRKFYNTSIPHLYFPAPVVLTINPGGDTDRKWEKIEDPPKNLMAVRFRANLWNVPMLREAIDHYGSRKVPILITVMTYGDVSDINESFESFYDYKKHVLNSYYCLSRVGLDLLWGCVVPDPPLSDYVDLCGNAELWGEKYSCADCRNCEKLYWKAIGGIRE